MFQFFVRFVLSILLLAQIVFSQVQVKTTTDEKVIITHSELEIEFDKYMFAQIIFKNGAKALTLNSADYNDDSVLPNFYVIADSQQISSFLLDFSSTKVAEISSLFGKGTRVSMHGFFSENGKLYLQKTINIELYDDFPRTVITTAVYKNVTDNQSIRIDEVFSNCYQLDATQVSPLAKPNDFYSFYGTAGRPFRQIEKMVTKKLNTENFLGRPYELEGIKQGNGGIPVVDLWRKEMGIGIGHIEPEWQNAYLPMRMQQNGKVYMAIREIPNMNRMVPLVLKPSETFESLKTFVHVHNLDFFETLQTYSELMRRQGIDMHTKSNSNDYLSAWCSWNDYSTHGMASKKDVMLVEPILERLPDLFSMKIGEVIFDAGWFNNQGDWLPNTDSLAFPGGDLQLTETIKKIHDQGLKVKLWISFLTADPWSEVARLHPDWMIQKPDGNNHLDRWSGYTMCPSLLEVQEYHAQMAQRFVGTYGANGFKVDGMYVCPPCYNPLHKHVDPNESSHNYQKVFKAFFDAAKSISNETTIMSCPCGTICDYTSLPYVTQTIAADPKSLETVRRNAKMYRALKGNNTPYSSDYIDIKKGNLDFPITLANAVGIGAVPQTFYGQNPSADTMAIYEKWFRIYAREMISTAEYLPLYDMQFDVPETHAFRKTEKDQSVYYFSFFADDSSWQGRAELRGLDAHKQYRVYDYVNDREIAIVNGEQAEIEIEFSNYLLLKCVSFRNDLMK